MGINPDLLIIRKPDELDAVSAFEPGDLLFADESGILKRMPTESFYPLLKNIKPISPSDTGPFSVNTLYKPSVYSIDPGTNYPNAGNLKAIEGYDTLFYYDGSTWTKMANKMPQATQSIVPFSTSTFPLTSIASSPIQRTYDNAIWQLTPGETASSTDVPGTSPKWISLGPQLSTVFDPTTQTKAQGGKQIEEYLFGGVNAPYTLGSTDISNATGNYTSSDIEHVIIMVDNVARTKRRHFDIVTINCVRVGGLRLEKYSLSGNNATRIAFTDITVNSLGVSEINMPSTLATLEPNEFYGVRMSVSGSTWGNGRIGFVGTSLATENYKFYGKTSGQAGGVGVMPIDMGNIRSDYKVGLIFKSTTQLEFSGKVDDAIDAGSVSIMEDLFGHTYGERNYEDANSMPFNTPSTNQVVIFKVAKTTPVNLSKFYAYISKVGLLTVEKYKITGSDAQRVDYAQLNFTQLGPTEITLPDTFKTLQTDEEIGIRISSTSAQIGIKFGTAPIGYETYVTASNTASFTLGASSNYLVGFKAIKNDGLLYADTTDTTTIDFPQSPATNIAQLSGPGRVRNDGSNLFRLANGALICTHTSFGTAAPSDQTPSVIRIRISYDNGYHWKDYSVIPNLGIATQIGIPYYDANGKLRILYEKKTGTAPLRAVICMRVSEDHGKTWGNEAVIVDLTSYLVISARNIHVHNGAMYFPYNSKIDDSSNLYFYNRFLKSTDGGLTWVDSGFQNQAASSTDSPSENGFYTDKLGRLIMFARMQMGGVKGWISTDNGATFGAETLIIANAPDSTTAIRKLKSYDVWIAVLNKTQPGQPPQNHNVNRRYMYVYKSTDGINFTDTGMKIYDYNGTDLAKECQIYEDEYQNGILVTWTRYYPDQTKYFNVMTSFIPLEKLL